MKILAVLTAGIFFVNQIGWAQGNPPLPYEAAQQFDNQNVGATLAAPRAGTSPAPTQEQPVSSTDFLQGSSPLRAAAAIVSPPKILSYTSGLSFSSVTTLPGVPFPYITPGSSTPTALSHNAFTNQFGLSYNVTAAGSQSGFTISFDDESTPAIETRNLSALTNLIFGLKGPNTSIVLEIVDSNNAKDIFTLNNISKTSERFWRIATASISNSVDKTKIKSLNFIVTQANTTAATRTGTVSIRTKGLNVNVPRQPTVDPGVSLFSNQSSITLSGTRDANTAILINNVVVVPIGSSTTWTATVNLTAEGSKRLDIKARNSIGKLSTVKTVTVVRDTMRPTGSMAMIPNTLYTSNPIVTLNLLAADSGTGVDRMSFSTDGVSWSALEVFAAVKSYTLPEGEGNKTVYVQFYDKAGNASDVYSKSIILDTLPPAGSIQINDGSEYINQTSAVLNLSVVEEGSGIDKMSFSSDGITYSAPETYAPTKSWDFASGDGNKTVYVKYSDKSGKWSVPVSAAVELDTKAPEIVVTSEVPERTRDEELTVQYTADGIAKEKVFQLLEGMNTLTIVEADAVGNESSKTLTVELDTKAPEIVVTSVVPERTRDEELTVQYTADGIAKEKVFQLLEGINALVITETDLVGNESSKTLTVELDTKAPEIVVTSVVPERTRDEELTVQYTADGIAKEKVFQLLEGMNTLTIVEVDAVGNESSKTLTVELDTKAPEIVVTSVVPERTRDEELTVQYTADGIVKTKTFQLAEGINALVITETDLVGNESTKTLAVELDTIAPEGLIDINGGVGVLYTNSQTITLNLSATDSGTGMDTMRFSNDGVNWSALEIFAAAKSYTLPEGEGNKTVYVKFYDKAGNASDVYSKSIILDTLPPAGSIQINDGSEYINQTSAVLNLSVVEEGSGIDKMSFSSDGITYSAPETYAPTKSWDFASGDGNKTVYVKYSDKSGKWSAPVSGTVLLDTSVPTGWLIVGGNAQYTSNPNQTVMISASDNGSGLDQVRFSYDDGVSWNAWENYVEIKEVMLPPGDGVKGVQCEVRDKAGNIKMLRNTITLDTTAPEGHIEINHGEAYTIDRNVTIHMPFIDTTTGLGQMRFTTDTTNWIWTEWEDYQPAKIFTLPDGDGLKQVFFQVFDKVWNLASDSASIILRTTASDIEFLSSNTTTDVPYLLRYKINGTEYQEKWQLAPGENELLVNGSFPEGSSAWGKFQVAYEAPVSMLNFQQLPILPETILPVGVQESDLLSLNTADGLVLKYYQGDLVRIEKPGEYQLSAPKLDGDGNLTGGVLIYPNGDQLQFENSKPVYKRSQSGEKTIYDASGNVTSFETTGGKITRFAYRLDDQNKPTAILSLEEMASSLYQAGKPVWVVMQDGSEIRYENGMMKEFRDMAGLQYRYTISELRQEGTLTGYRSQLSSTASNTQMRDTIQNQLALNIEYDTQGNIQKFISGQNEVLTLQDRLPVSLRDAAGNLKAIQNVTNAKNELQTISISENSLTQTFDADGRLDQIRLADGSSFDVKEKKLDEIILTDGSSLSGLKWNGNDLTDFMRTKPDGVKEIYESSRLVRKEEPNGNITTYSFFDGSDHPDTLTTTDGRTYHLIEYKNSKGLTERITELLKIDLPDGSKIEFERGKPVRFIQKKEIQLDPLEVPLLAADRSFVPLLKFPAGELRAVTIDAAANILSGEILFNDGTQYVLKDGVLLKQITPDGRVLELENTQPIPFEKPAPILAEPLNEAEEAYRRDLIENQFKFFMEGIGIDADTGMPVDNYKEDSSQPSDYSQATLVGFWAEILTSILRADYLTDQINPPQAWQKLLSLLQEYRKVQTQAGWNGMVGFFKIIKTEQPVLDEFGMPTEETTTVISYQREFDNIGIGDNLNLSVSLATVLGAIGHVNLDPNTDNTRNQIVTLIQEILNAQDAGYNSFYDASTGRFRMARVFPNTGSQYFAGHMDRVFNEFRTGLVWLAARNPAFKTAVENLDVAVRPYQTAQGKVIDMAVPFDGNVFQMFWPLIHVDETRYPEFDIALKNFLYAQAEFVKTHQVPGLLSAGDDPGKGYNGKIGLAAIAETDDALNSSIGSLYGTASAFLLAPHYTLQFLKNIETKYSGIKTSKGYVDALIIKEVTMMDPLTLQPVTTQQPVCSTQFFGVDQASFILSLLGTSRRYFNDYLRFQGYDTAFDSIYKAMSFNLNPVAQPVIAPPDFGMAITALYSGSQTPDGSSNGLVKQPAFISSLIDPELGEGKLFDYRNPDGKFHHTEIEFTSETENGLVIKKFHLQEYLLLPGRETTARSLFGALATDLLNEATAQGAFYTPDQGYANGVLTTDSKMGEVRQVQFDLKRVTNPVGIYAIFNLRDLSEFDYLSIPVKRDPSTPANVRIKIEFKGLGEIFVSNPLSDDWEFLQIPIAKPAGLLKEIAIVVQSTDGSPIAGDLSLGPLSAFKVRTSNQLDWKALLGNSDAEIKNLLKGAVLNSPNGGGIVEADEVLENFTVDSDGKLINGTLKRADGSIQYFQKGQLTKWVFPNGRTVIFEKGLASFILDLSRGTLREGRFYYDQSFRGQIRSFVVQDNDRKRTYGADGKLQSMVDGGRIVDFKDGVMDAIRLADGTVLNQLIFGNNQGLLRAHVKTADGREFDIDQTGEQVIIQPNGVRVYYQGPQIKAVETEENGRTDFEYVFNAVGQLMGVNTTFKETITDSTTGLESEIATSMSLFDYIRRPERSLEKAEILREPLTDLINRSNIGGFSVGFLPFDEITWGLKKWEPNPDGPWPPYAWYQFRYNNTSGPILGMLAGHYSQPYTISNYDFVQITLQQDAAMTWDQDFNLRLKTPTRQTLYTFQLADAVSQPKTFAFSLAGKSGSEGEITLEVIREAGGVGKVGTVYVKDISYLSVKTLDRPLWETLIPVTAVDIQSLKIESDVLTDVGAEIGSRKPLKYDSLVPLLDLPSWVTYTDKSVDNRGELVSFKRVDGSEAFVEGQNITKVILPDGTVNEYSQSGNQSQAAIQPLAQDSGENLAGYQYGALRKITQSDGHELTFSYEFDTDGKEITIIYDPVTKDERRFKDGKLLQTKSENGLATHYRYEAGELAASELMYKNRVLDSTRYRIDGNETHVTDERGTTWYYDANGNLIKHLTQDGYLFEYLDYTQTLDSQVYLDPEDYKHEIFNDKSLKAVRLAGYEGADGSQILFHSDDTGEIRLASGAQAVNLQFDGQGRIKEGQLQLANGIVISIENYLPVQGRRLDGSVFEIHFPKSSSQEFLVYEDGTYQVRIEIEGKVYFYDIEGKLSKAQFPDLNRYDFTYIKDASGNVTDYEILETKPLIFRGIPYPKTVQLQIDETNPVRKLKFTEAGKDLVVQEASGFVAAVFNEKVGGWDTFTGSWSSAADRFGLRSLLAGIKTGEYVAFLSSDSQFSAADEDMLKLFESFGSGKVREAASANQNFAFFGMKGLSIGEGAEALGNVSVFSSAVETTTSYPISPNSEPTFDSVPVLLHFPVFEFNAMLAFLNEYQHAKPDYETQAWSIYNSKEELVYTKRLDGVSSYYQNGKARETFDEAGALLYTYDYDSDGKQTRIQIVKAKVDFEKKIAILKQRVEQEKFDALYQLAWRDDAARLKLKEEVDKGLAAISNGISQLEAQRFQDIKTCGGFFKRCKHRTIEVPGVADAINNLHGEKSKLIETQTRELGKISDEIEARRLEVENGSAEQMAQLDAEEKKFKESVLHQEMEPILINQYREILGRDPSTEEINQWIDLYRETGIVNTVNVSSALVASAERIASLNQKQAIITEVENFLNAYVAETTESGRAAFLSQLGIQASEKVDLDAVEVKDILDWLKTRDLHFGQSAFLALKEMLQSRGTDVPLVTIAKESILIDILTGTINRFTEGELLLSIFALMRTAKLHGQDFAGVKYTFEDLKALYAAACPDPEAACSLRLIAHIGEDHFVVITHVTAEFVSYRETNKGPGGEEIKVPVQEFLKVWLNADGNGYLIVPEAQAIQTKKISDQEAQRVRGAFFWLIFVFIAAAIVQVAAAVMAVVSFVISMVLAVVTAVLNVVVNAIGFIFTHIAQGISLIGRAFFNIGKLLYQGIKFAGRFLMKGFQFVKDGFTRGLSKLGSEITKVKNFLLKPIGKPFVDTLGHNILDANGNILRHFSTQQVVARHIVVAGLNMGVSKGLEGMGLNPALANLAGAFVGSGFLGIGAAGSSFFKSGLQGLLMQGVSEMGLKIGLPPPITGALSIFTSASLKAYFDSSLTLKQTLTTVVPQIGATLAFGGMELLGRSLGINPQITALLGMPVMATVGGLVQGLINPNGGGGPGGVLESIKNSLFSRQTLGGIISVGANIALDALGVPPAASSFVSNFLGQMIAGNSSSNEEIETQGEGVLSKIGDGIKKFGSGVANAVGSIFSFGKKIINGVGQITAESFKKAASAFSGIFDRKTQESIYQDETGLRSGTVTTNGHLWRYENGGSILEYDTQTDTLTESFGLGGKATIEGLSQDDGGNFSYKKLTYEEAVKDQQKFYQNFENGKLTEWGYSAAELSILRVKNSSQPWNNEDDWLSGADIEIHSPTLEIPGPDSEPLPDIRHSDNVILHLNFFNGKIAEASMEVKPGKAFQANEEKRLDKELYVLVNGIDPDENRQGYMHNLQRDLGTQSQLQVNPLKDVIVPLAFGPAGILSTALKLLFQNNAPQLQSAIQKLIDIFRIIKEQKAGVGELTQDVKDGIKAFADANGVEQLLRRMVGVAYSGGFVPLVEAMIEEGYNAASFVALGGTTLAIGTLLAKAIVSFIQEMEKIVTARDPGTRAGYKIAYEFFGKILGKIPQMATNLLNDYIDWLGVLYDQLDAVNFKQKVDEFYERLKAIVQPLTGYNWGPLLSTRAGLVVNIWGTEDPLAKLGISGYRDDIGGYNVTSKIRPLFNIEIEGADHYDYVYGVHDFEADFSDPIKRQEVENKNKIVSGYVTRLILNAKDPNTFEEHLRLLKNAGILEEIGPNHWRLHAV